MDAATAEHVRLLLPLQRSVVHENFSALRRRWQLVRSGQLEDPRAANRWFPRQRELLELLATLDDIADVRRMAHVGRPLFTLPLRFADHSLNPHAQFPAADFLEEQSIEETFLALTSRLDAVRMNKVTAASMYNMTSNEADALQRYCPAELRALARDPSLILVPVASPVYFMVTAVKPTSYTERTVFATVSRRPAAMI